MYVTTEYRGPDPESECLVQVFGKAMDEVVRRIVAPVDQRVMAVHYLHTVTILERRDIGLFSQIAGQGVRTSVTNSLG
jgi:hypothetical protein